MADWDPLRPRAAAAGEFGQMGTTVAQTGMELRPLSLGEVLDRIFSLYRSRFWLFAAISSITATIQVITQAITLTAAHDVARQILNGRGVPQAAGVPPFHGFASMQVGGWIGGLVVFLVASITQAATVLALSRIYLREPVGAKQALVTVGPRWYRWIGIALWQAWSFAWIPLAVCVPALVLAAYGTRSGNTTLTVLAGVFLFVAVCGGFPAGVVLYLRNALAIPAAVTEGLNARAAMRRSKVLAVGTKGRIFVVLLIAGCLYGVVGALQTPAALLIMLAPQKEHYLAQAISLVVTFAGTAVVAPVALIGLTLVYFDQRVRKEALDLQFMLEGSGPASASAPWDASQGPRPDGYAPQG